jgi:hypothetical protein
MQQQQQQIVQQLPNGQFVQRPLNYGGGGMQSIMSQQSFISPSNSVGALNSCHSGPQIFS